MMSKINYYSFKEIVDFLSDNVPIENVTYPSYPNDVDASADWFSKLLDDSPFTMRFVGFKASSTIIPASTIIAYVNNLINIVYDRHAYDYIAKYIGNVEDMESSDWYELVSIALNKLINVINLTAPKYIPLLYQYVQNYEDPIKMLESVSQSMNRFNDTPQNSQDEVDYNTADYATNMGKSISESKVDSGSVLDRLEALKDKFRSIILDWSNEFNQLFIADIQLED